MYLIYCKKKYKPITINVNTVNILNTPGGRYRPNRSGWLSSACSTLSCLTR